MMKKRLKISKKIYVSPLVEFEEIEQDELDMLMISQDDGTVDDLDEGDGDGDLKKKQHSVDMDFSMDFVINDELQY